MTKESMVEKTHRGLHTYGTRASEKTDSRYDAAVADDRQGLSSAKKFGGMKFYPIYRTGTKRGADFIAGDCREFGYHARVVKVESNPHAWKWTVYVRKK